MSRFDPIEVEWKKKKYKIEPNRVMKAIAIIEETVTLVELYGALANNRIPLSRLSMAFAAVLRYAGADVKDEDVYASMFGADQVVKQENIALAIIALLSMMQPPKIDPMEERPSGNAPPAVVKLSGKRSKQRSATTNGSALPSSGPSTP
ncbi:MAG: hypothetical protein AB7Q00_14495 [Phycisphaerales bacterium]